MLIQFVDLPVVSNGGKLKGLNVSRTVTAFDLALRKRRVCSAAGDYGALNAWRDDKGQYRACFCQWLAVKAMREFPTKAAMLKWVKKMLPKLSNGRS